ncbi:MAG TPA: alpha/beta hydrolase [Streptosporangiaceae bacterium]|jgi:pimeloyl-ACP methyl ester carboxylesterase
MSVAGKRSAAFAARVLRRMLPASRPRRFVVGGVIAVVSLFGSTAAAAMPSSAPQAHAARPATWCPVLPGFTQGMVPVDGGMVHYVMGGSGPVLVLLHGWPETWWEWRKEMPAFAKNHTVIAFDLPGLGRSTVPSSGFDAVTTATRIREAVHDLGFGQVEILGHDLGVLIAFAYARDYPGEVTRLGVLDSALNGFGLESAYTLSFHFLLNMAASPTPEDMINNTRAERAYLNYMYTFAHKPRAIARQAYYAAYASPANREAGFDYYRAFPENESYNLAHQSEQLTIPVLAMGGQYSFGTGVATSFDNVAKDVHQVVAPGSGHFIPEEDPHFLIACAGAFFSPSANPKAPAGYPACAPY